MEFLHSKKLAWIFGMLTLLLPHAFAILPKTPSGSGGYYVLPFGTAYITAIFNNTEVCADEGRNLVCSPSEITTLNAGEQTSTSARIIFTNKPVAAIFKSTWNSGCTCGYGIWGYAYAGTLFSSQLLGTEYYVPYGVGNVYITATQYRTKVNVTNSSGTFEYSISLPADYIVLTSPETGTRITSDKPVVVTFKSTWHSGCTCAHAWGIWGYAYAGTLFSSQLLGTEYYVPYGIENVYITAIQDSTEVWVDRNVDGIADEEYEINASQYLSLSLETGARITSDKPIVVTFKSTWNSGCSHCGGEGIWGYAYAGTLFSSQLLGTEYYVPYGVGNVYITATQYKTKVNVTNSSGTFEYSLSAPDYIMLSSPETGTRITSDKPIVVTFKSTWNSGCSHCGGEGIWGYAYAGTFFPLSPSTVIKTPGLIALNEYGTIRVRLFNPTSETLYNISFDVYTHKNFTLVGDTGVVNVTIYKKNAHTDSVISSDFVQKSYSLSGEENVFEVGYQDSSLLSALQSNEYIEIVYEVISNHVGHYTFKAQAQWKATHWA